MSYRFARGEKVEEGLRRVAFEQIDSALAEVDDSELGLHETTHQIRKRCKKLRALLRLVRFSIGEEPYREGNAWFRDTARLLSGGRDRAALRGTYDVLLDAFQPVIHRSASAPLARALAESQTHWIENEDGERLIAQAGARMQAGREHVEQWKLQDRGFAAIAEGLEKTYRRGRKRFGKAYDDPTAARFHEWRKRVKYGWYQMRLIQNVWPQALKVRRALCHELSGVLGDHHDLSVMHNWLSQEGLAIVDPATVHALLGITKEYQQQLEQRARPMAQLLFAEKPSAFVARMGSYCQTTMGAEC